MVAQINNILSSLIWPENTMAASQQIKLGSSFTEHDLIKRITALITTRISRKTVKRKEVVAADLAIASETKFYLFVLILNQCFDPVNGRIYEGFESMVKLLSQTLNIDEADYQAITRFYACNKLYCDVDDSIYISPEKFNPLLKAKGINIHFKNQDKNRVVYLKFFSRYNVYLAKTFYCFRPYNAFEDEVRFEELNIVSEKLSPVFQYATFSFEELKREIENFNPLQYIQVSGNDYLPGILLDPHQSIISITGSSAPLSVTSYFEPILEWISIFKRHGKNELKIYLNFDYFNTYTTRFLIDFVTLCKKVALEGKEIYFFWHYDLDDQESREFGGYLQNIFLKRENFHLLGNDNTVRL